MSPTPPSTSSSVTHSPDYRVVRKRNRVPVSCGPCRNRKLKCNRAMPCENCVKRSDAASCTYAQPKNRKRNQSNQHSPTTPDDMQNRIDRLEGLVLSLMTNGSQSAGPTAAAAAVSADTSSASQQTHIIDTDVDDMDFKDEESDTEQVTKSFGVMKVDNRTQKSYYISEAHWSAMLVEIGEVKQFFANNMKQYDEQVKKVQASEKTGGLSGAALIFGAIKKPTESEILASIPSKYTTDILVRRFFATHDPCISLIHRPTFQKEYALHWQDPSQTSMVWIGMVFAMMRLSMLSYHRDRDEPPEFRGKSLDMAETFRHSMAQCLIFADFTKPLRYVLETLSLHLQGESNRGNDSEISVWILTGMIIRLGMRMGYHRDAKMFPNISAFQGEMRRRIWTWVRHADLLFSFQVGLPTIIRLEDSDTGLPRNLYDEDFDEDCTELPSERPANEPTPVSYIISHAQVSTAFSRVLEQSQKVKGSTYEEVMEVDSSLREARDMIPEWLRMKPMAECENEPTSMIMNRFSILNIYHKAQCVLHRPFLPRSHENPRYVYSRGACIDSALELLRFQSVLHAESLPDGRLQNAKWYTSTLNSYDFLTAGTILAVDLYIEPQRHPAGQYDATNYAWGSARKEEILSALHHSRDVWKELSNESLDAWKATMIMTHLLESLKQTPSNTNRDTAGRDATFDPQDEKQNAAMTLGLLSSGLTPAGPASPPQYTPDLTSKFEQAQSFQGVGAGAMEQNLPTSPFAMFGQMQEMQSFNLDWDAWDTYIQTASLDPTNQGWGAAPFDFQQLQPQQQQSQQPPAPIPVGRAVDGDQILPPFPTEQELMVDGQMNDDLFAFHAWSYGDITFSFTRAASRSASSMGLGASKFSIARTQASPAALCLRSAAAKPSQLSMLQCRQFGDAFENNSEPRRYSSPIRTVQTGDRPARVRADRPPPTPKTSIFVGNLFFDVTAEDLKNLLSKFGEVQTARVVYDAAGLSRGFGYVSFKTVDEAQAAIVGMQGQDFEGRKLNLNFAYSSSVPPVRSRGGNKEPTRTIYVGNMSFQMNEKDLDTVFADVPNIHEIRVAVDRRTGIFRGFVHVEFVDVQSAVAGYEAMQGIESFGRKLVMDYSSSPQRNEQDTLSPAAAGSRISMGKSIPEGGTEEFSPEETPATESATETEGEDTSKNSPLQ